mgnify:CR=1 FL=1
MKDKLKEIAKDLQKIIDQDIQDTEIEMKIKISADHVAVLEMIKIFMKKIDSSIEDNDIYSILFNNGIIFELQKMKEAKEKIYNMGNIETLADERNIGLSDKQREVAQKIVQPPKTIDEYWQKGYNTIQCPHCKKRAVLHEKNKDYHCIDGCKKEGFI